MTVIETTSGRVRGLHENGILVFRGIPYAQPPLGERRFLPPREHAPWPGVRDAFEYGSLAVQWSDAPVPDVPDTYVDTSTSRGEDCLVLNVWTPARAGRRPVMVWCHGGGYAEHGGHGPWTDGAALAREEDVVVVSFNHRLHAFGFLFLADVLGEEYADSGNAGVLDIVAVLRWVRENAAGFGGDPGNVTLVGESGGGWKINTLLSMPAAAGLFHRAVIQSGSGTQAITAERARRRTETLLDELEIGEARGILEVPAERIAAAARRAFDGSPARLLPSREWLYESAFAPVIDDRSLRPDPGMPQVPAIVTADIPLLIGTNRDEWGAEEARGHAPTLSDPVAEAARRGMEPAVARRLFDLYRSERPGASEEELFGEMLSDTLFHLPATLQADAACARGADVYRYLFCWGWAPAGGRSPHIIEVPFVFGNIDSLMSTTADPAGAQALSHRMRGAWAAFARSGRPAHPDLPDWTPYAVPERATMILDRECRIQTDPRADRRRVLMGEPVEERASSWHDSEAER